MHTRSWLLLFFPLSLLWGCHTQPHASLRVQDDTQSLIRFEYALITQSYRLADSSTKPLFTAHEATPLSLPLDEPTFVVIRHSHSPQTYLLLLAPNDEAQLTLHPISYEVTGSQESLRVRRVYKILRQFNDSIARLNQRLGWMNAPLEGEAQRDTIDFEPHYQALLLQTREALKRFVIDVPYSKANLVALSARFDGTKRFFDTPELRPLARNILQDLAAYYHDRDFAQQLLIEYTEAIHGEH